MSHGRRLGVPRCRSCRSWLRSVFSYLAPPPMQRSLPELALVALLVGPADAQPSPLLRSLVEELRIDGKAHDWAQVTTIRVGPHGHILVGERRGTMIRVFSP